MFEKPPILENNKKENHKESAEKERAWNRRRQEVEQIKDALGLGIDEKIKDAIVVFNLLGISTAGSCEGHIDHGISAPYIDIAAPNEPGERYLGENEIYQQLAKEHNVSFEELKKRLYPDIQREFSARQERFYGGEETEEYQQWWQRTEEMAKKASDFLKEFYEGREVEEDLKLTIKTYGGCFRVHNAGKDEDIDWQSVSAEQKSKLLQRLNMRQEEMQQFTDFLKKKFFKS